VTDRYIFIFNLIPSLHFRIIEEIGFKAVEHSPTLISVLLTFLRDSDITVVKQSIVSGTNIFGSVFEELILQVLLLSHCLLNNGGYLPFQSLTFSGLV